MQSGHIVARDCQVGSVPSQDEIRLDSSLSSNFGEAKSTAMSTVQVPFLLLPTEQ